MNEQSKNNNRIWRTHWDRKYLIQCTSFGNISQWYEHACKDAFDQIPNAEKEMIENQSTDYTKKPCFCGQSPWIIQTGWHKKKTQKIVGLTFAQKHKEIAGLT